MQKSYDVTQSLFSAKASEGMIAFAGFRVCDAENAAGSEGVLKIAAFTRPDGGGYLTLTFVIDLEGNANQRSELQARFRRVDQDTLAARLGADFEMLLEVPLNIFAETTQFYIEELNLYFHRLAGRERWLLEDQAIPMLGQLLDFVFDPLDWLAETQNRISPATVEHPDQMALSLKERIKRYLELG
ncbi:MAG: hypothetical protein ACOYMW_10540 [Candidatus Competibacteraceae bacterium]